MTLNYECIRDTLLYLENNLGYTNDKTALIHKRLSIDSISNELSLYTKEDVMYTIEKLIEANYINSVNVKRNVQGYIIIGYIDDITWEGFEFLNNIREKSIWDATKQGAKKIGAMSIYALKTLSFEIVKAIVTNQEVINNIVSKFH